MIPESMTAPSARFYAEQSRIFKFFVDLVVLRRRLTALLDDSDLLRDFIPEHSSFIVEMLYARLVDNFLAYLSDLVAYVLLERSSAAYPSLTEQQAAEQSQRKIQELSNRGWRNVSKYFDTLHLHVFLFVEDAKAGEKLVDMRNLIAHQRGRVDRRFADKYPGIPWSIGDRVMIGAQGMVRAAELLWTTMNDLDARAAERFGIPRTTTRAEVELMAASGQVSPRSSESGRNERI